MRSMIVAPCLVLMLAGCAAPLSGSGDLRSEPIDGRERQPTTAPAARTEVAPQLSPWIDPSQAVQLAATAAPRSVAGVFAIHVKGTGKEGNVLYLNSEADYRDPRNLTAVILPNAGAELADLLGNPADVALEDKRILVTGEARRVKIFFIANGRRTDKYYYQTHLVVSDASQIQLPAQGADTQEFTCQRQFDAAKGTLLANTRPYAVIFSAGPTSSDDCIIRSLYASPLGRSVYIARKWIGKPGAPGKLTYADSRTCAPLSSVLREVEQIAVPALPGPESLRLELLPLVADNYRLWTNRAKLEKVHYEIEFSGVSIARWIESSSALDGCWREQLPRSF